jgi:hypothetical protein
MVAVKEVKDFLPILDKRPKAGELEGEWNTLLHSNEHAS